MNFRFKELLFKISRGRTEYILEWTKLEDWKAALELGPVTIMQWLVYFNDLTGLKWLVQQGASLSSIDLNNELGNAAFFGHWKICDWLIQRGADVNARIDDTDETPLHNALCKANRPYYLYTVRLLLEKGADPNAQTKPGIESGAFMRDVRTVGETPLHRAAAYADDVTIQYLLEHGAVKDVRDANGDSPLSWASRHLRPGKILSLLAFDPHRIGPGHLVKNTSDHGSGWGNSMDWNLFGEYDPD